MASSGTEASVGASVTVSAPPQEEGRRPSRPARLTGKSAKSSARRMMNLHQQANSSYTDKLPASMGPRPPGSEKEDRDTVAGEAGGFGGACADGRAAGLYGFKAQGDRLGELAEVGGLETVVHAGLAGTTAIHEASLARVFAAGHGLEAGRGKQGGHPLLLFVDGELFDGAGEVLGGEQVAATFNGGDTDGGEL